MKIFKELLIILLIYFLGELISKTLNLPIPGNILGMVLLLMLLCTKVLKLSSIEKVANFLLDNLAFFFIPSGVGIISSLSVLQTTWHKLLTICILSTAIVIIVTGYITQILKKYINRRLKHE